MMGWDHGMMYGWFGMLFPIILIGIVIYAVVKLAGANLAGPNYRMEQDRSLGILNERFVKGELSEEEYKEKKELILQR